MLPKREYVIEFGALPKGQHEFEFEVDDSFFQQFEGSIISRGHADVLVVLERQQDNLLLLDFTIEGTVTVTCDRCLDDLDLDIVSYNELVVKLGEQAEEQSDDVIVIPSGEHNIDIAQFIYEYVTLAIPMRNVHEEDESGNSGNSRSAARCMAISTATGYLITSISIRSSWRSTVPRPTSLSSRPATG